VSQTKGGKTMPMTLVQRDGEPTRELQVLYQIKILDKQICKLEEVAESLIAPYP